MAHSGQYWEVLKQTKSPNKFEDDYFEPEEIILTQYKLLYLIDEKDPLYNLYETEEEIDKVILSRKYKKNLFYFLTTIGLDFADNFFTERISYEIFEKGKLNYFDFKLMRFRYTIEFKLYLMKFLWTHPFHHYIFFLKIHHFPLKLNKIKIIN